MRLNDIQFNEYMENMSKRNIGAVTTTVEFNNTILTRCSRWLVDGSKGCS